ncbi:SRR1-domain-containing protein [Dentipellis sp. KUC8613]|nr:SRR1-domain-containing protein [Dentipellis sp. KUC8613]
MTPMELYERCSQELGSGNWLEDCHQMLRGALDIASVTSPRVFCLGLGCPASSKDARAQLAFLLRTCDVLSIDRSKVSAYDPVFAAEDVNLLTALGVAYLDDNKRGRYPIGSPTLLFMPHCDAKLYENILRENWSRDRLPHLFMLCNLFSEYLDSTPSRQLAARFPCLTRLAPYLVVRALPSGSPFPTAFTSTAVQFVTPQALPVDSDRAFWDLPPAAANDDAAGHEGGPRQGCLL